MCCPFPCMRAVAACVTPHAWSPRAISGPGPASPPHPRQGPLVVHQTYARLDSLWSLGDSPFCLPPISLYHGDYKHTPLWQIYKGSEDSSSGLALAWQSLYSGVWLQTGKSFWSIRGPVNSLFVNKQFSTQRGHDPILLNVIPEHQDKPTAVSLPTFRRDQIKTACVSHPK